MTYYGYCSEEGIEVADGRHLDFLLFFYGFEAEGGKAIRVLGELERLLEGGEDI